MSKVISNVRRFMQLESSGGIFLIMAAILAMLASNSFLATYYDSFLNAPVEIRVGALELAKPLLLWINDGLMAVFFFLVGLEIKRELIRGELSSVDKATLPFLAAIGGMAGPAIIYSYINWGNAEYIQGWAIPSATDIAFALGVLSLLGNRVPVALKIFLLALAIIDDIGAIIIIAVFYTANLSTEALALGMAGVAGLFILNRTRVSSIAPYILVGTFIWVCVLKSGVHATLAGVVTALFIPLTSRHEEEPSPLISLEHALHPWVAFMVLPLFAFANAGIDFRTLPMEEFFTTVTIGIAAGLFFGNQIAIFTLCRVAVASGIATLPKGVNWIQLYGTGCLAGIGFTMSLFIGTLAFDNPLLVDQVRLGVLTGSLASALLGFSVLWFNTQAESVEYRAANPESA